MKATKIASAVAVAAFAVSGAAIAGPGWTFVEVGYGYGDNDMGNIGPGVGSNNGNSVYEDGTKGYTLDGSLSFGSMYHVALQYAKGDYYEGPTWLSESERKSYSGIVGIHPAVTDATDLVLELNYTKTEYSGFAEDTLKDTGGGIRTGLRSMLSDTVEANAFIGIQKTDYKDVEVAAELGGAWSFAANWALTADAKIGESETQIGAGIRWYLGQYNNL